MDGNKKLGNGTVSAGEDFTEARDKTKTYLKKRYVEMSDRTTKELPPYAMLSSGGVEFENNPFSVDHNRAYYEETLLEKIEKEAKSAGISVEIFQEYFQLNGHRFDYDVQSLRSAGGMLPQVDPTSDANMSIEKKAFKERGRKQGKFDFS